jgi:hypothetical protein
MGSEREAASGKKREAASGEEGFLKWSLISYFSLRSLYGPSVYSAIMTRVRFRDAARSAAAARWPSLAGEDFR